jgi:hypothetical protein
MERATNDYADVVLSKLYEARQVCPDARLFIEQRLDFSHWVPEGFGTGDAVIVSDEVLEVCDLKYGKGVRVSAIENPQARLYGLGALAEFGALYDCSSVRDTIIQPRVLDSPVTEETLSREELLLWGGQVQPIAQQAWRGEGEYNPGDWCRFCAARALCAARAAQALRPLTHGFDAPGLIPDEDIPGILAVADTTEAWLRDIRAYAKSQAMRGQQWRGYKLVRGRRGNRAWKADAPVAEALSQAGYREEQYMVSRVKTPGEMEKELGKQAFDDLVGRFVTQAEGALNLAPDSDAREAVSPADADFSDLAT